jgi:hypothetical protein
MEYETIEKAVMCVVWFGPVLLVGVVAVRILRALFD